MNRILRFVEVRGSKEKQLTTEEKAFLRHLGRRLGDLRHAQGHTQASLAATAQLHRNYVSAVERGEYNLTVINIVRIAKALGITAAELLTVETDDQDSPQ